MINTHQKNVLLALFCLLATLTLYAYSAILTGSLFFTLSPDERYGWLSMFVGAIIDSGKIIFPILAGIAISREKYGQILIFMLLTGTCITVSFSASMAFDLNQNNAIKNEAIVNSADLQRQNALFNTTDTTIKSLREEIKKLKDTKESEIVKSSQKYQSQLANAKRKNFITTPGIGVNSIKQKMINAEEKTRSKIESQIATKETELSKKENKLTSIDQETDKMSSTISTTKGIRSFAAWINPKNPDDVVGKLNVAKNVILEILIIGFTIGFGVFAGREFNENGIFNNFYKKLKHNSKLKNQPKPEQPTPPKTPGNTTTTQNTTTLKPKINPQITMRNNEELIQSKITLIDHEDFTKLQQNINPNINPDITTNTPIENKITPQLNNAPTDNNQAYSPTLSPKAGIIMADTDNSIKSNTIGFKYNKPVPEPVVIEKIIPVIKGVSDNKVRAYIDTMFDNVSPDNTIPAMIKLVKMTNDNTNMELTESDGRTIYGHLKCSGIVQSNGKGQKSSVLVSKKDIKFAN